MALEISENVSEVVPHTENTDEEEEEEKKHFQDVVNTFRCYKNYNYRKLLDTLKYINSLPLEQQVFLQKHKEHLRKMQSCIEKNYDIITQLLKNVAHVFENKDHSDDMVQDYMSASLHNLDKLHGIFKQVYREWSVEGKDERDASFKPILDELYSRLPIKKNKEIRVLVPGSGLGRLAFEIAKNGYVSQGNEISLFMLFMSNFIINKSAGLQKYQMHPWIHVPCNHFRSSDQLSPITFPDINPNDFPFDANFSIAAGSFTEIYTIPNSWDCIVTCFFIDTAHNVVAYIDTIWKILKPDGLWINLGPLLYHHADVPDQNSIELSYEEIKHVIERYGFCYLKEDVNILTPYCQNPKSMLSYNYKSVLFVCKKPSKVKNSENA